MTRYQPSDRTDRLANQKPKNIDETVDIQTVYRSPVHHCPPARADS